MHQLLHKLAPDFTLPDENNTPQTLSRFKGHNVVLYFYPKDNTPGCTQQACSLRDAYSDYVKHDIQVMGVNYDSPASHKAFKEKYHLPFILLSDSDGTVAQQYGANSGIFGYFVPKRITFLINKQGVIIKILENVDVHNDAQTIVETFKNYKN